MANETATVQENTTITGPKVVGMVDLGKFEKKQKSLEYKQFGSFPIALYTKAFALAQAASKKIGIKDAITVSKTSKIKVNKPGGKVTYEDVPEKGSIWYGCSIEDLKKHFVTPLHILEFATERNIRKFTKAEFLHLSFGKEFFLMYVGAKGKIEVIRNIRVDGGANEKEGVCYRGINQTAVYCLPFSEIKDDSTFNTGVAGETGYIYVTAAQNV